MRFQRSIIVEEGGVMVVFDELKSVAQVLQEAGKIEQYRQILDAQKELLQMQKKIQDIETEKADLLRKLEIRSDIFFENNVYWRKMGGDKKEGPYCSRCWDEKGKLIHMHNDGDSFFCPACGVGTDTHHIMGVIP
jgi:hypothetical protein